MLLSSSVGLGLLEVKTFPCPLTDYSCKTTVLNDRPPPLFTGGTKFHNTFIEDFATIFSFQVLFNLFKRSFIFFTLPCSYCCHCCLIYSNFILFFGIKEYYRLFMNSEIIMFFNHFLVIKVTFAIFISTLQQSESDT